MRLYYRGTERFWIYSSHSTTSYYSDALEILAMFQWLSLFTSNITIFRELVLNVVIKRHRKSLCTLLYDFYINKQALDSWSMKIWIPIWDLCEIYLKNSTLSRAGQSVSHCIKFDTCKKKGIFKYNWYLCWKKGKCFLASINVAILISKQFQEITFYKFLNIMSRKYYMFCYHLFEEKER